MSRAEYLVYDIETVPTTSLAKEWRESEDYEKDKKYQKTPEGQEPFPPLGCHRVITIGALVLDQNLTVLKSGVLAGGAVEGDERAQVARWNEIVSTSNPRGPLTIVDWNGRRFDAPVLQFRAFRYGIDMSWYFKPLPDNKGKISSFSKNYRDRFGGRHVDLAELWTNSGAFNKCHMKDLAQLMGLPGKAGIDGSMVHGAWLEDRHKEIDDYCVEDVWHTGFIMMRMRLLAGSISVGEYRTAVLALLGHASETEGHEEFLKSIDKKRLTLDG
ncbi:MAG: hypothetical protein DRP42_00565 [Tenericutes bacterium]|nr:MAG: hypothetical protein DRP42_00565 [Mycoplasmatota bacterium]